MHDDLTARRFDVQFLFIFQTHWCYLDNYPFRTNLFGEQTYTFLALMIRILLVDDHEIVLQGLRILVAALPDITVAGALSDSNQVTDFLANTAVDILISDLNMPGCNGLDLTRQIRQAYPAVKILMLTMTDDAASIRQAIQAGVHGYVLKRTGPDELQKAMQAIMQGRRFFGENIVSLLAQERTTPDGPFAVLSDREMEVLILIATEHATADIANHLFISVNTVETHRRHLLQKLNVKNVAGLVRLAMRHGLVS
jgi:DNA-binding NarL/FixJ family response regulator